MLTWVASLCCPWWEMRCPQPSCLLLGTGKRTSVQLWQWREKQTQAFAVTAGQVWEWLHLLWPGGNGFGPHVHTAPSSSSPAGIGEQGVLCLPALGITGHARHWHWITQTITSAAELPASQTGLLEMKSDGMMRNALDKLQRSHSEGSAWGPVYIPPTTLLKSVLGPRRMGTGQTHPNAAKP